MSKRDDANVPSRIAFGSCNHQHYQNDLWPIIESREPAAFIWGGDSIYADVEQPIDLLSFPPKPGKTICGSPGRVRQLYQEQLSVPGYQSLLRTNITIFGSIDDHDYGCDNADKHFKHKAETTKEFLNFIGEPVDSPVSQRARNGAGVYGVKLFDFSRAKGEELVPDSEACLEIDCAPSYSDRTVAVFTLDVRTNKDPWLTGLQSFSKDPEGDFLGPEQWEWFHETLNRSRASVNVIVSGLQINLEIFPSPRLAESWSGFPKAQQRLYNTILDSNVSVPLMVSGDVHMTQLSRRDCSNLLGTRRSLVELTTSGMTHSWGRSFNRPRNNPNYKFAMLERLDRLLGYIVMASLHLTRPWKSLMVSDGGFEGTKAGLHYSLERNFGELDFDWENRFVTIRSFGEQHEKAPLLAARFHMAELSGNVPMPSQNGVSDQDFVTHSVGLDDWTCLPHRGTTSSGGEIAGHLSSVLVIMSWSSMLPLAVIGLFLYFLRKWQRRSATIVTDPIPILRKVSHSGIEE